MNWMRYEDKGLAEELADYPRRIGLLAFSSSAEAVAYLNSLA
jgi:hypothetical protein